MATVDQYKVVVDVVGQQQVENLSKGLAGLAGAIAGVATVAFAQSILTLADNMSDLAESVGLTMGAVTGFSAAVQQAGGDFDNAGKGIVKFYRSLEEASTGSKSAQESLGALGITLSDINTKSEGQLLSKAIDELAGMEAGAKRTALQMELFGKSFANVDPKALQEMLKSTDAEKLASGLEKVKDANDKMTLAMFQFKVAAAESLAPLIPLLDPIIGIISVITKHLGALGITMGIAFGASMLANIKGITLAMRAFAASNPFTLIAMAVGTLVVVIAELIDKYGSFGNAMKAVGNMGIEVLNKLVNAYKGFALFMANIWLGIGKAILAGLNPFSKTSAMDEVIGGFQKGVTAFKNQLAADGPIKFRFQVEPVPVAKGGKSVTDLLNESGRGTGSAGGAGGGSKRASRQIADDYGLAANRAKQVTSELKLQNEQKNELRQLEIDLIGVESNRAQLIRSNREAELSAANEIADLEAQINLERAKGTATNQAVISELQAQIQLKNDQLDQTKKLNQLEYDRTIQMQKQNDLKQKYSQIIDNLEKRMAESKRQNDPVAGAKQALEDAAKYTTPFAIAEDSMLSALGNMNRAIDDFVDTGKFKFADFARSMIADIMKIIIKALVLRAVMSALGMPTGTTSTSPVSFGDFFKPKALGGPVTAGKPYIVGEKGAEMFVPNSNGSIVPNNKLGGGQPPVVYNITNNISALDAKSVAQIFVENRKTLLGATNMARKETPYGA